MSIPTVNEALFGPGGKRLKLEWLAGTTGAGRPIVTDARSRDFGADATLAGHLNLIHPNDIQILGASELNYLQRLGKNTHADMVRQLFADRPAAVILDGAWRDTQAQMSLKERADEYNVALLFSPLRGDQIINHLRYYLLSLLAGRITLHGVFMEVMGIGVLLTGDSGVGKSELALELISRGHRLIADDAPEFSRTTPETITGTCPEMLRDFLEVRGLGVINVRAMFGDSAVRNTEQLCLIVHLQQMNDKQIRTMERTVNETSTRSVLEVDIPELTLPVAPGRNLAVLVEGAVRNHILRIGGYNAAHIFRERQRRQMEQGTP